MIKSDLDTLVNLDLMIAYLKQMEGKGDLALGVRIGGMPLVEHRSSRNYQDPLVYPRSTFPPYLSGACYVLSGSLVQKLQNVLREVPVVRNEDTFIGMCLEKLGIQPSNIGSQAPIEPWFDASRGPCAAFRLAAVHPLRPDLMHAMWTWWKKEGAKFCR
ncbi:UDP-gal:beta c beta-polypeptide related protein [Cyclospora cayetanensis]|nr:UDP-gal:beta c beta-polypeptide related protein [Cyclospora cayetanensis]